MNLFQAWDVPTPGEVRRPEHGTNNQVWLTDDLVLRVHHHADAERILADRAPAIEAEARQYESTLAVQIIHGDFALSNLLVEDNRVTGILDFEIAGLDLRAVELAAALLQTTDTAEQIKSFRTGYGPLSPAEEQALPALTLYRALGSAVWRAGHWRTGHSPINLVTHRLTQARALDATP